MEASALAVVPLLVGVAGLASAVTWRFSQATIARLRGEQEDLQEQLARFDLITERDHDGQDGGFSVVVRSREELFRLDTRLHRCTEVWVCGKTLLGFLTKYRAHILAAADAGTRFRFLIADYRDEPLATVVARSSETSPDQESVRALGSTAASGLDALVRTAREGHVAWRTSSLVPLQAVLILNPRAESGELCVEWYGHRIATGERYHFVIQKQTHPVLFQFFVRQFLVQWGPEDEC